MVCDFGNYFVQGFEEIRIKLALKDANLFIYLKYHSWHTEMKRANKCEHFNKFVDVSCSVLWGVVSSWERSEAKRPFIRGNAKQRPRGPSLEKISRKSKRKTKESRYPSILRYRGAMSRSSSQFCQVDKQEVNPSPQNRSTKCWPLISGNIFILWEWKKNYNHSTHFNVRFAIRSVHAKNV